MQTAQIRFPYLSCCSLVSFLYILGRLEAIRTGFSFQMKIPSKSPLIAPKCTCFAVKTQWELVHMYAKTGSRIASLTFDFGLIISDFRVATFKKRQLQFVTWFTISKFRCSQTESRVWVVQFVIWVTTYEFESKYKKNLNQVWVGQGPTAVMPQVLLVIEGRNNKIFL